MRRGGTTVNARRIDGHTKTARPRADTAAGIGLTPAGRLRWDSAGDDAARAESAPLAGEERAPKWHQVGRVCFHLAENRGDDARPFAFMATYASGFGAAGRLKHLPLRKALEQYAGAKNRAALVKLLSPVQQAAEVCDWVQDLVDSGEIYQPVARLLP